MIYLAGEAFVSVWQYVSIFVMFPRVENFANVKVVPIVASGSQVHHERRLEIDLIMAVFAVLVPENKSILDQPCWF